MAQFDISVDEILRSLGRFERREFFDSLANEFDLEVGPRLEGKGLTPTEKSFQDTLIELWRVRSMLTPEQVDRISRITTEPVIQ